MGDDLAWDTGDQARVSASGARIRSRPPSYKILRRRSTTRALHDVHSHKREYRMAMLEVTSATTQTHARIFARRAFFFFLHVLPILNLRLLLYERYCTTDFRVCYEGSATAISF